jgi:Asp/Glu/hydantoin racemase
VLECTNLTPFSSDIQQRFGIPVFDMVTLVNWFHHGLNATRFPRGD